MKILRKTPSKNYMEKRLDKFNAQPLQQIMNAPTITITTTRRMEVADSIEFIRDEIDDLYSTYDELKAFDGVNPETLKP